MKENFIEIISSLNIEKAIEYLKELMKEGKTQNEVYKELENIRKNIDNEEQEDFILEIMDIVSGWISPNKEIWKN